MLCLQSNAELRESEQDQLLEIARRNVELRLQGQPGTQPNVENYATSLRRLRSSFVTLRKQGEILSRAGTVEPTVSLVCDVSHNSYEAAAHRLSYQDLSDLTVDVCIVAPLNRVDGDTLEEILTSIQPGKHGVLLKKDGQVATLTPDMWNASVDAAEFFRQLQLRAGLDSEVCSADIHVWTYLWSQTEPIAVCRRRQPPKPKFKLAGLAGRRLSELAD